MHWCMRNALKHQLAGPCVCPADLQGVRVKLLGECVTLLQDDQGLAGKLRQSPAQRLAGLQQRLRALQQGDLGGRACSCRGSWPPRAAASSRPSARQLCSEGQMACVAASWLTWPQMVCACCATACIAAG